MLGIGLGSDGLMYVFEEHTLDILGLNKEDVESIMSELADKIQSEEQGDHASEALIPLGENRIEEHSEYVKDF